MTTKVMTVDEIRKSRQPSDTAVGLTNAAGFELTMRIANMLTNSTMVPEPFRKMIQDKKQQKLKDGSYPLVDNPSGLPNCIIAINMANRMGADPLMIMQNLYIVEGRPSWSSQFVVAAINGCGRYSPLRFDIEDRGEMEAEYTTKKWQGGKDGSYVETKHKITIRNLVCVAWAIETATGHRLESSPISMEMAVKEGWYQKNGSKWQTMPEQMLRYRAASFFGRIYAPELLMGLRSADEEVDRVIDITPADDPAAQIAGAAEQAAKEVKNVKRRTPKAAPAIEQQESVSLPESFSETHEAVPVAVVADPVPVAAHAPTASSMFDQAMAAIARATTAAEVQQAMRYTNDMTADDLNRIKDAMGKKNRELMGQVSMPIPAPAPEKPSLMVRMQRAQTQDELDMIASEIDMADPEIQPGLNEIYVQESKRLNQLPL